MVTKIALALIGFLLAAGASRARAGSVSLLAGGAEVRGAVSLDAAGIHVAGSSTTGFAVADILEADFTDAPFHLVYFASASGDTVFPPEWKGVDIGNPAKTGSVSFADGNVTLTGAGADLQRNEHEDQYYVFGRALTGDDQLIVRLKEVDDSSTRVGLMVRENLSPLCLAYSMGVAGGGNGLFQYRRNNNDHVGWNNFASSPPPIWERIVRCGASIDAAISADGHNWETIDQTDLQTSTPAWLGLFLDTFSEKKTARAVLDQVTLAPCDAGPETVPPGVLLRSGSFLAGSFHTTGKDGGNVVRNDKTMALKNEQIAAVVLHPVTRRQIAAESAEPGLIMRNGDYLAAEIQGIDGSYVMTNSMLLGLGSYGGDTVRACVFQPEQPQSSDWEVRLNDGSILRAKSVGAAGGQVTIAEVSGVAVEISGGEIAQVRAGLARVQPLIETPWQAVAPSVETATAPRADAVDPALSVEASSGVRRWAGPNQEQILAVPAGNTLKFTLTGKFKAIALRAGFAPDTRPNAQGTVRILAGGKEVWRSPALKSGDQPLFAAPAIPPSDSVTIMTESNSPGLVALLIDPVAIRAN